jgi:hypothetical protein
MTTIPKTNPLALTAALILAIVACFAQKAAAANPTVTATLSGDATDVGQPVDLSIEVQGAQSARVPERIEVDGLNIVHTGQQTRFQMQNLNVSSSVIHTYSVVPQRAGRFSIPAVTIEVDGQKLTTSPLSLNVGGSAPPVPGGSSPGTGPGAANQSAAPSSNGIAFAELVVPKETAYVGEVIPIEIRIYFDAKVRVQANEMPDIKCEGFTVQKMTKPSQERIEKNGRLFNYLTVKTAVTPVKSGKLTLGPAKMEFVAQVPQRRNRNHTGAFDDFFNEDFFNGMFMTQQQMTVKSAETGIEVKPLPRQDQPEHFSGAVGQFSLETDANPRKLNIGDPITLKLKVTGRGNFDLVSAPGILDETGWRSYPPSNKFTPDDDVGISGSKVFEQAVIPGEKKSRLPLVEFVYFDPLTEKYVTLKSQRLPIQVEGQATPAPAAQTSTAAAGRPSATPVVAREANDIHYILTGPAGWGKSFTPVFRQRDFWNTQMAPAVALLAFIGFTIIRRKQQDVLAAQAAEWRRQKSELLKSVQREGADPQIFYDAAIRYIQIEAARELRRPPASIGATEAIATRKLDIATGEAVQSIFNAHAELVYAGAPAERRKVAPAQRQSVLDTLKKFENAREENV